MALYVSVAIDDVINKIDKPYDYSVPDSMAGIITAGMRVIVPFSNANIRKMALILSVEYGDTDTKLKELIEIVDSQPVLDSMGLSLVGLLKSRYSVSYYRAFRAIVPRGADFEIREKFKATAQLQSADTTLWELFNSKKGKLSYTDVPDRLRKSFKKCIDNGLIISDISAVGKLGELKEKRLILNIGSSDVERMISELGRQYEKQRSLLSVFLDYNELSEKNALYYSGCTESTVKTLARKGVISIEYRPLPRNPYKDFIRANDRTVIELTDEQQTAYNDILAEKDEYGVHLIHGVTGSGKTLVYISLIDKIIDSGKSVIIMVPEISLTPQTLQRFYSRYGDMVAVVHSGLAPGERADEWRKIKKADISVVVGTRSAVFAPCKNLGMIVIDEEHETSYKSESSPRYHARDIAKAVCGKLKIPLVLGSATPSIESGYLARKGIYRHHRLTGRFNNNPLPETEIIDMREAYKEGSQSFLSERLREAIESNLESSEQTILFLNRRGAHTMEGCRSCGYVAKCPNCGIALTYHLANDRCMCHYCGYSVKMFTECPECGSKHIKMLGTGTQLVHNELQQLFPKARILRMDFDTISSYVTYADNLNAFMNGDYDIMLGTQMVAKGLDFPNVTLVGVLNADLSLYVDDFRANERTFSLLTQVCGRSGRAGKEGIALIQTYSPDYEVIKYARMQDYDRYFDFEINFRRAMNYPPFCDLVRFTVSSLNSETAYSDMTALYKMLDSLSKNDFKDIPIRLLYPTLPKIPRFNDRYRYNLVIKTRVCSRMYELLHITERFFEDKKNSELAINVNPMSNV